MERFLKREFGLFISDADECNASVPVCDANANCQNTVGSFICTCKTGFTGNGFNCSGKKNMEETGCFGLLIIAYLRCPTERNSVTAKIKTYVAMGRRL